MDKQHLTKEEMMIISETGEILQCFLRQNGIVVRDGDFSICLEYSQKQKEQYAEIASLKKKLEETDYKALKYADGALSREEYEPVRKQRQKWRDRINEIEKDFEEPTITREEMDRAEERAMKNVRCREV